MRRTEDITITLIIPIYNVELYLKQCLDSVIEQTILFDEVILVNDGSTDNSLDICKSYIAAHSYFKLISQENKGLSVARNVGIRYSLGKYIMFLDSDDYLRSDALEILKGRLQNADYDAIFFDSDIQYETDRRLVNRNIYDRSEAYLDGILMNGYEYFSRCYPRDYVVSACMAVYKKDMIVNEKIYFPEGRYYEDNYFTFVFMNKAESLIHISDKLYQRRYREYSITISQYSEKKFVDCIEISRLIWSNISESKFENIPKIKKLISAFISDQCIRSLEDYKVCTEQKIVLSSRAKNLLKQMIEEYVNLLKEIHLDDCSFDLSILMRIQIVFHYIDRWKLIQRMDIRRLTQEIVKIQKELYINKLKELPFDKKDCRVGIYGSGKHTEGLLLIYEKLVGKIECNLSFIDSERDNEVYRDKKLVHIQRIKELKLDLIVISSFIYERQMIQNVKKIHSEVPVYTFYGELNGDIFSNYQIIFSI